MAGGSPIARARSFPLAPASRPERFAKALQSGADFVILDLEDAPAPEQKDRARDMLADGLAVTPRDQLGRMLVRINAAGTSWHATDLQALAQWIQKGLAGVMVPKSDDTATLNAVAEALGANALLVPLVESLAGLDAVDLLASAPQVTRLAFGHLDFQLDLAMRCSPEEGELASVRLALVAASRRARSYLRPSTVSRPTPAIATGSWPTRSVRGPSVSAASSAFIPCRWPRSTSPFRHRKASWPGRGA